MKIKFYLNIMTKLSGLFLVVLMTFFVAGNKKSKPTYKTNNQPNILIIIPDDLGWRDVGYHGSEIKTPNIDKLAKSGVRLNQHYVMPTCTPTRVSLMTGKYPSRYGIIGPDYGEVIDLGDPTLASILKENGYYTAIAGKWHMGSPPYTPLKYGFQSSYGYFDGQIDPYTHEYKTETALTERRSWHRSDEYFDEEGHVTDLLTIEAIRIIEEDREEPFFLYLAYHVPHYPLDEPDEWMNVYKDKDIFSSRKLFAASVSHMDDAVGKIIDALERTGQRENTLIFFTSDNGGQLNWQSDTEYRGKYANKPHNVLGNNYPLRGWKGDLYEGGIRVPAFINWPGRLEPGVVDLPVHVSDWLPTLCEVTGTEIP
jgi:arylsulfatase A-like enzyme